jgi:phage/plasmid-like protein (TIGR03299 family)
MAHELSFVGGEAEMGYNAANGAPWHKLGQPWPGKLSIDEAFIRLKMDWRVEQRNMTLPSGLVVPDRKANVRIWTDPDSGQVHEIYLGNVGHKYRPIQNEDSKEFLKVLTGAEDGPAVDTAGVLQEGRKVWFLLDLPGDFFVGDNDQVRKTVLLSNSHDGSYALRVFITPIRVVCMNTLSYALTRGDKEGISIRHTASAKIRMEEARRVLGLAERKYQDLTVVFNRMRDTDMTMEEVKRFFEALVPDPENATYTTKSENTRTAMMDNYHNGRGAELAYGTLWGAYNAVTEFADHTRWENIDQTKRKKKTDFNDDRLRSVWFGAAASMKFKALDLARDIMDDKKKVLVSVA